MFMTCTWNGIIHAYIHKYMDGWMDTLACTHSGCLTQFTILCLEFLSPNQHLSPLLPWFGGVPRTPWLVTTSLHCPVCHILPASQSAQDLIMPSTTLDCCPALLQRDL